MQETPKNLRDFSHRELERFLAAGGHQRYRADQVMDWLYQKRVESAAEMSNLPAALRDELSGFSLSLPAPKRRLTSEDGAVKVAYQLEDGELIEAVWMPDRGRASLCVSTQAGCRMGCVFCRTGAGGFKRNLRPSEITGQVLAAIRDLGPVNHLVFMGMGEPLDNVEALLKSIDLLCHERGPGFSPGRIIVSTLGLIEGLERLARGQHRTGLAVSLHSANPQTRQRLVPRAASLPLEALKSTLRRHPLAAHDRLTIEVVLVSGVNDSVAEAKLLASWLSDLKAAVNLIPLNPFPESGLDAPARDQVLAYQDALRKKGVLAFIRQSRGADILAACGQLKAQKNNARS